MKRIALSVAVLGLLAVFNAPASASDLSVFLRGGSHGRHHVAPQPYLAQRGPIVHHPHHHGYAHRAAHGTRAYRPLPAVSPYGYGGNAYGRGGVQYGYRGVPGGYGYPPSRYGNPYCQQPGLSLSFGF